MESINIKQARYDVNSWNSIESKNERICFEIINLWTYNKMIDFIASAQSPLKATFPKATTWNP